MRCVAATLTVLAALLAGSAHAKLPPLSDEAKAKAALAAPKTAWSDKVAAFKLCKAMDRTAATYYASMKQAGKESKPPVDTPACADPGPFSDAATAPAAPAPAPAPSAASPKQS